MDLQQEELQFLTTRDILRESISIPRLSPKTFYLITLTLVFPLSFAVLAHNLFTHPLFSKLQADVDDVDPHTLALLLAFQLGYLLFLFALSLLSTAAVVFTVASLYTAKPVSFSATFAAIPKVLKPLAITFLWIAGLIFAYHFLLAVFMLIFVYLFLNSDRWLAALAALVLIVLSVLVHLYISALWHLASVISVLEPVYGLNALRKSRELLRGRTRMAVVLISGYFLACMVIGVLFGSVVVRGGRSYGLFTRIVVGGFLVGLLVIVNLVGLLLQSVFYYVCKSFHHQGIDKSALHDHLGGYLGEYVPLKSSIQLENLDT